MGGVNGKAPTLGFERSFLAAGHRFVAGCDEVGRGALAGPVSVGMVVIDATAPRGLSKVRDSKLLTPAARQALVPRIRNWALAYGVGHASAAEIDALGLIAALRLAGTRAWWRVLETGPAPQTVILDGNHNWLSPRMQESLFDTPEDLGGPPCGAPVVTKIKADMHCLSVAAASVLAKVERDAMLAELSTSHPQYGWDVNKGYATASHRAAIGLHGPSPYHRMTWRLTGEALEGEELAVGGLAVEELEADGLTEEELDGDLQDADVPTVGLDVPAAVGLDTERPSGGG